MTVTVAMVPWKLTAGRTAGDTPGSWPTGRHNTVT